MREKTLSLKVWIVVLLCFVVFQYLVRSHFEKITFNPGDSPSLSDGHFYRIERDFKNASSDELKVVVIGSSRVAKGIECPEEARSILTKNDLPQLQLNKIWESYDPFQMFVEDKNFLKRLIPIRPDLICIQADMLAIEMPGGIEEVNIAIERKLKKRWHLEYKGDEVTYIPQKLKYQSKVNQEIVYNTLNANSLFKGEGPCIIHDNYVDMDTLSIRPHNRNVKKMDDIRYTFEDLEMLNNEGIKIVIIDVPLPGPKASSMRTPKFTEDLQSIKMRLKDKFDIDYWEYSGQPLYYRYYADRGHLNPEGRSVYTEWLLGKIHKEMSAQ